MFKNKFIAMTVSVFVIVNLAACNLTEAPVVASEPSQQPAVPLGTQVAEAIASTLAAQTALANALASTQVATVTATPEITFTPSFTPTATFTFTPAVPMVSVSVVTNCRSGPTTAYDILGVLNVGETAEVVGRSTYTDTMIIKLPSKPSITCWLWTQNATVVGNTSGLQLINVPPTPTPKASPTPTATPTPQASFNVVYSSTILCSGKYGIKFQITNTGTITWESNSVYAKDLVSHEENTKNYDDFPNVNNSCALASDANNLEAGEVVFTFSNVFIANPAGHGFTATIRVCSQNGMAGTCLEKTITFTP